MSVWVLIVSAFAGTLLVLAAAVVLIAQSLATRRHQRRARERREARGGMIEPRPLSGFGNEPAGVTAARRRLLRAHDDDTAGTAEHNLRAGGRS